MKFTSELRDVDVFVALVQSQDYDVIIITETWLNEEISSAEIQMQGYDIFRGDRQIRRRWGGVLIYTKAELNATVFTPKTKFPEQVWCRISNNLSADLHNT